MKTSNGFVQGYNVQAVVDEAHQVIVATSVSNRGTDMGQIPAMVRLVMKNTGRKMMVEPVFGQIKECRGFRRFSLRGQGKVSGEWDLAAVCHNLLKLYRYGNLAMDR